jgi:voltage-gated potassium channel
LVLQSLERGRARVHRQLDPQAWGKPGLSPVNKLVVLLILLGTSVAIVETEPEIYSSNRDGFEALELFFGTAFLIEYLARLWSVAENRGSDSALSRRLRFVATPSALIDLLVIAAAFIPAVGVNPAMLRLVRLARIARLAKLGRMSSALRRLTRALWLRRYELGLTLVLAVALLILAATALYWLEGDIQPAKFGSIPRALWWAVTTLTTIGYGDVYPLTAAGKMVAALLAMASLGLVALPAGIMAAAMQEVLRDDARRSE